MPQLQRAIVVVLDGVGAGENPDSAAYGDSGASSLEHCAQAIGGLTLPHLGEIGLGNITPIAGTPASSQARGAYGRLASQAAGKDSVAGHWEMMGVILKKALPTYPHGFPAEIVTAFEEAIGRSVIGNVVASGTEIIQQLGEEHVRTGSPILYTSADSVFQVAAHEEIIPLRELYHMCELARGMLIDDHAVGRVIARPFIGSAGAFQRTGHRRDFALAPLGTTLLDLLKAAGHEVIGIGKIEDLFAGRGLTHADHTETNRAGMDATLSWLAQETGPSLIFVNLVEFDMLWGHRRDSQGYAQALREVVIWLPQGQERMRPGDALFFTADHGVDPTYRGTDHTRECVPLLAYGQPVRPGIDLGIRSTIADLGQTLAETFGVGPLAAGTSFAHEIGLF